MGIIDLNCDVGEGIGNEAVLFPYISSCNIACGAHAGDDRTIQECIMLALQYNLKIGAHPSYPDREHFGRRVLDISMLDLFDSIQEQIESVLAFAKSNLRDSRPKGERSDKANKTPLHHVKPHGALYNKAARDEGTAATVIKAIQSVSNDLVLYAPYGSVLAQMAQAQGLVVHLEGFADRNYNDNYSLVSRSLPNALIKDPKAILAHITPMILENKLQTTSGALLDFDVRTLCLHGDTPGAELLIKEVHTMLTKLKITIG